MQGVHYPMRRFSANAVWRPRQCQWIAGEPGPSDKCKCQLPTVDGSPYCREHTERARRRTPNAASEADPVEGADNE